METILYIGMLAAITVVLAWAARNPTDREDGRTTGLLAMADPPGETPPPELPRAGAPKKQTRSPAGWRGRRP